eukprot:361528-Chlamydomonas_euryale.AAC.4
MRHTITATMPHPTARSELPKEVADAATLLPTSARRSVTKRYGRLWLVLFCRHRCTRRGRRVWCAEPRFQLISHHTGCGRSCHRRRNPQHGSDCEKARLRPLRTGAAEEGRGS